MPPLSLLLPPPFGLPPVAPPVPAPVEAAAAAVVVAAEDVPRLQQQRPPAAPHQRVAVRGAEAELVEAVGLGHLRHLAVQLPPRQRRLHHLLRRQLAPQRPREAVLQVEDLQLPLCVVVAHDSCFFVVMKNHVCGAEFFYVDHLIGVAVAAGSQRGEVQAWCGGAEGEAGALPRLDGSAAGRPAERGYEAQEKNSKNQQS